MNLSELPNKISQLIQQSFEELPLLARQGMPLHNAAIDHVAIALQSKIEMQTIIQEFTEAGIPVVEPLHLWPDDIPECPKVADEDRKWMATADLGEMLVVLLAPHADNDLIARFIARSGRPDIHHIAFAVHPIGDVLETVTAIPNVRQITPLAKDEDYLCQVFLKMDPDIRIIELIERVHNFRGTFTCNNITALTAGERQDVIGQKELAHVIRS